MKGGPGALRDRVSIQRKQLVDDGGGGTTFTWSDVTGLSAIRGRFTPERGRERIENDRLTSSVAGTLKIRSSTASRGIQADDRATINGELYHIHAVMNPDRKGQYLELSVTRGSGT